VYVKENEWLKVGDWVYNNFDVLSGVSFLPYTEHIYKQAPYQAITKEEYERGKEEMPREVDWSKLSQFEHEDNTITTKELACTAGSCDI
jgi:ribonucleoside-diphosphate reductase alpha chain